MSKKKNNQEPVEQPNGQPPERAPEIDAEAQAAEWREKYVRTLAELDNYRKRMERERDQSRLYACEGLMRDLLPVLDDMQLACAAEGDADAIRKGVELSLHAAMRILEGKGLAVIEALNQPFDPRFHEAMGMVPGTDGQAPNTVVVELARGYRLHERVLRPSRVQIALPVAPAVEEQDGQDEQDEPESSEE
ncbi:MAG: nucleotide exchange factor GrpE [Planctomycetota bacterium]|nr:nucleotide exchange factor GrpE [Planctomycetota bacterium]